MEYYSAIKRSTEIYYSMDESQNHYAEWKKLNTLRIYTIWLHLHGTLEKCKVNVI